MFVFGQGDRNVIAIILVAWGLTACGGGGDHEPAQKPADYSFTQVATKVVVTPGEVDVRIAVYDGQCGTTLPSGKCAKVAPLGRDVLVKFAGALASEWLYVLKEGQYISGAVTSEAGGVYRIKVDPIDLDKAMRLEVFAGIAPTSANTGEVAVAVTFQSGAPDLQVASLQSTPVSTIQVKSQPWHAPVSVQEPSKYEVDTLGWFSQIGSSKFACKSEVVGWCRTSFDVNVIGAEVGSYVYVIVDGQFHTSLVVGYADYDYISIPEFWIENGRTAEVLVFGVLKGQIYFDVLEFHSGDKKILPIIPGGCHILNPEVCEDSKQGRDGRARARTRGRAHGEEQPAGPDER